MQNNAKHVYENVSISLKSDQSKLKLNQEILF